MILFNFSALIYSVQYFNFSLENAGKNYNFYFSIFLHGGPCDYCGKLSFWWIPGMGAARTGASSKNSAAKNAYGGNNSLHGNYGSPYVGPYGGNTGAHGGANGNANGANGNPNSRTPVCKISRVGTHFSYTKYSKFFQSFSIDFNLSISIKNAMTEYFQSRFYRFSNRFRDPPCRPFTFYPGHETTGQPPGPGPAGRGALRRFRLGLRRVGL